MIFSGWTSDLVAKSYGQFSRSYAIDLVNHIAYIPYTRIIRHTWLLSALCIVDYHIVGFVCEVQIM